MPPRSAGSMTIGSVIYTNGVFSVEMLFTAVSSSPGEDEIKSAARVAAQQFFQLLHINGYATHSEPQVEIIPKTRRSVLFYMAAKATKKKPVPIVLVDPDRQRMVAAASERKGMRANGNGEDDESGDQVGDET